MSSSLMGNPEAQAALADEAGDLTHPCTVYSSRTLRLAICQEMLDNLGGLGTPQAAEVSAEIEQHMLRELDGRALYGT